ncbi:glycosyltransferase family 87 protein [uncultured Kiloniella sp.]|uniref:glycosyltransferase family 87 protein n=1 Tax=uncultured Kiloniella sp. TaxID=1133091 RepID=UPI002605F6CD|nr:glycosyltransferase family 87 protein [uncultured Kiloniella sp.]
MLSLTGGYYLYTHINLTGLVTGSGSVLGGDFLAFYTGGAFLNQDILQEIYSINSGLLFPQQIDFQTSLISKDLDGYAPFLNPPFMAFIYSPFAKLPYVYGFIIWQVCNFLVLLITVNLLRQELVFLQRFPLYKLIGCCFLFYPTLGWFMHAQATPIILLIYVLSYKYLRHDHDFKAGFCLGLIAFKPQLAIALAIVLILKWRWQALLGGILSVSLCLASGFIFLPDAMIAYMEVSPQFLDLLRSSNYPTWGIHSFFGFSVLLLDDISTFASNLSTYIASGCTILLLCFLWHKSAWKKDLNRWDLAMAITFIWGVLLSPHLYYYDLMLLLLPAAIIINSIETGRTDSTTMLFWIAITWAVCFMSGFISIGQILMHDTYQIIAPTLQLSTPIIFLWGLSIFRYLIKKKEQITI